MLEIQVPVVPVLTLSQSVQIAQIEQFEVAFLSHTAQLESQFTDLLHVPFEYVIIPVLLRGHAPI